MADSVKQVSKLEVDERFAALLSNAGAIRAIASTVEGTLGPKGLNCMLVDKLGDVTITNDGSTILDKIEVNHPAAKLLINTAKAQDSEVGDGTTTAAILASSLITEGVNQIVKGVPVTKVMEGIRAGIKCAIKFIQSQSKKLKGANDPLVKQAAVIAGRGHEDIAELVTQAVKLIEPAKLEEPAFKLADWVVAKEGAENEVFNGLITEKERMNPQMPKEIEEVPILVVDDALEPEELEDDALGTESGFAKYLQFQQEFKENIERVAAVGVKLIVVNKGVHEVAEEILTDAGVMVLRRVSSKDLAKIVEHTGAKTVKRASLKKGAGELKRLLGFAKQVYEDEKLGHVRIEGGKGEPIATILVGASTEEVKEERLRIAKDAAAGAQSAIKGGVVAGAGAIEVAAIGEVSKVKEKVSGMAAYGVDCVIEALKKPLTQIIANAGFNPLEKIGEVLSSQKGNSIAINCDTGEVCDMYELGVVDSTPVKVYALKAAGELAEAILSINTVIKKRIEGEITTTPPNPPPSPTPEAGGPRGG